MGKIKVLIIGGGPAGMMAAILAGQRGCDVTLIEKNDSLGKKLLLTGNGRCNLTNMASLDVFLEKFSGNGQFLRDAFKKFCNKDLLGFFRKRGVEFKTEEQGRVFPVTDKANSILKVLIKELHNSKVKVIFEKSLKKVIVKNGRVESVKLSGGRMLACNKLILAAGGFTYPGTGSTGEGIEIAKELGHEMVTLRPGLVSLDIKQPYSRDLEGVSVRDVCIKVYAGCKRRIVSDIGDLLFTAGGVSGPVILSLSGQIVDWLNKEGAVHIEVDFKPLISEKQLDMELIRGFSENPRKFFKSILKNLLSSRLIDMFLNIEEIVPEKKNSQVTQNERRRICSLIKRLRLNIKPVKNRAGAMITRGGVSVRDIDPGTMGSRKIKGLYFAGEIIDIDADTGGFNLQAAFSTGYLAGESAAL